MPDSPPIKISGRADEKKHTPHQSETPLSFNPITSSTAEFAEYLAKRRQALLSAKPYPADRQTRSTMSFSHFAVTKNPRMQRRRTK